MLRAALEKNKRRIRFTLESLGLPPHRELAKDQKADKLKATPAQGTGKRPKFFRFG